MKQNKTKLDVDFIGGQEALTKEEEKAISNYLKAKKSKIKTVAGEKISVGSHRKSVA